MTGADWIGSIGGGLVLLAYVLDVLDLLADDSPWFYGLNLVGASMATTASYLIPFWPFVVLEGTWAMVSAWALWRRLRRTPTTGTA